MTNRPGSRALLALTLGAALTAGCSAIREHQGYLVDEQLVSSIQPGIDNKELADAKALGRRVADIAIMMRQGSSR